MKASASVGNATLAMLVPSEDSSMDKERLAKAHLGDEIACTVASFKWRNSVA
ncbi:hypothetical protein D9M69_725690 [compost metagenome]